MEEESQLTEIVIHIGYPKTGTSFLQKKYFKLLDSKKSLNFVNDGSNLMSQCLQIENESELTFDPEKIRAEFNEFIKKDRINVISRESFTGSDYYKYVNTGSISRKLKAIFPEAKIFITLRNQADIATSIYSQYIHEGGFLSFNRFFSFDPKKRIFNSISYTIDNHQFDIKCLDYMNLLDHYSSLWGRESVKILLYETLKRDVISYLQELNTFLGIEMSNEQVSALLKELDSSYINESYTKNQIIFARIVNRLFRSHFNHIYDDIPILRLNNVMNFRLLFRRKFFQLLFGRKKLRSVIFIQEARKLFKNSNIDLFTTYFSIQDQDRKFYIDD